MADITHVKGILLEPLVGSISDPNLLRDPLSYPAGELTNEDIKTPVATSKPTM